MRLHENVDPHGSARELVGDAHPALLPFWARGVFVTAPLGRRLASHLLHPLPLAAREKIWQAASALRGDGRARAVERSPLERRDRSGDRSPGVSAAARVVLLPALRGFALGCREARERSSARQHLRRSVRAGMRGHNLRFTADHLVDHGAGGASDPGELEFNENLIKFSNEGQRTEQK